MIELAKALTWRTEQEFQDSITELAEYTGWKFMHISDSRRQVAPGTFVGDDACKDWPDLTMAHERHGMVFWECKLGKEGTKRGDPTTGQREWLERLEASTWTMGWHRNRVRVVRPPDWETVIVPALTEGKL